MAVNWEKKKNDWVPGRGHLRVNFSRRGNITASTFSAIVTAADPELGLGEKSTETATIRSSPESIRRRRRQPEECISSSRLEPLSIEYIAISTTVYTYHSTPLAAPSKFLSLFLLARSLSIVDPLDDPFRLLHGRRPSSCILACKAGHGSAAAAQLAIIRAPSAAQWALLVA